MKLILLSVLFLAIIKTGFTLKCYDCTSYDSDNCEGKETVCSTALGNPFCYKVSGKSAAGQKVAVKKCMAIPSVKPEDKCESKSEGGTTGIFCMCTKDLCNNADMSMMSKTVAFSLIFVAFLIQFI